MARPIDPERHARKRDAILEAAASEFAAHGYAAATTAGICRAAGISSGTFFHYFPSKLDALLGVLDAENARALARLAEIEERSSGLSALLEYAESFEREISDDGYARFVDGLLAVASTPEVAARLEAEASAAAGFLSSQVQLAQEAGEIRGDIPARDLGTMVSWLLDGAAQAAATRTGDPGGERPRIAEAVRAMLVTRAGLA